MQTFTVVFICALAIAMSLAHPHYREEKNVADSTKTSLYIESLRKLHRGPPRFAVQTRAEIQTRTIKQQLDHFDTNETATWEMRYMVNDEHFTPGGPMFIMLGGEWEITPDLISDGLFYDMGKDHNAMLFTTEHRYYGESKPTNDTSVDNLKYLHVKQALADLAHFIREMRRTVPGLANSKVIMGGCSYSATLIVWFKRLYPELLAGGWASSAPVLAKVDFREFLEVIGRAILELGGQKCYDRVKNGIAELESMLEQNRAAEVKAMLNLCNNFDEHNDLDVWSLFSTIGNLFIDVVQFQSGDEIPSFCNFLFKSEDDATAIAKLFLWNKNSSCVDVNYRSSLTTYLDLKYTSDADRQWLYQTCNEYGWFSSTDSTNQPFGTKSPLAYFITICQDVFGEKYTNEQISIFVQQTNADFGGLKSEVDNIFMTYGEFDPWRELGPGEKDGAVIIPKGSHCQDAGSIKSTDSQEMRAVKEKLIELVRQWLA